MKKIFYSAFSSQIVKGLLPLLIVPLFVSEWGDDLYSIWLQSLALVTFVSFFGAGLNNYGINRTQIAFAQSSRASYKIYDSLLSLNIFLFFVASLSQILIIILIDIIFGTSSIWLTILLGLYLATNNLFSYVNLVYRVRGRYHLSLLFSMIFTLILYSGMAYILINNFSPFFLAFWLLSFTLFCLFLNLVLIRKILNLYLRLNFRIRRFKPYFLRSYKFLFFQVGDYFRINLPVVFLGYVANPIVVVFFTINRTLSNILSQFYILIHHTIMQRITATYAQKKGSQEKFIYLVTSYITFSLLIYLGFILVSFYGEIMKLWIGRGYENYYDPSIFLLLVINSVIYCMWNVGSIFLVATNNFSRLSFLSAVHGMAFFIFLFIGYKISGLEMMLLFGILSELIFGLWLINREIYRYLKLKSFEYSLLYIVIFFELLLHTTIYNVSENLLITIFAHSLLLSMLAVISWKARSHLIRFLSHGRKY